MVVRAGRDYQILVVGYASHFCRSIELGQAIREGSAPRRRHGTWRAPVLSPQGRTFGLSARKHRDAADADRGSGQPPRVSQSQADRRGAARQGHRAAVGGRSINRLRLTG